MCKTLDVNTCYNLEIKFKMIDRKGHHRATWFPGVSITCICGETEYFVSPHMPCHKIIIPIDRRWMKDIRKLLSLDELKRGRMFRERYKLTE